MQTLGPRCHDVAKQEFLVCPPRGESRNWCGSCLERACPTLRPGERVAKSPILALLSVVSLRTQRDSRDGGSPSPLTWGSPAGGHARRDSSPRWPRWRRGTGRRQRSSVWSGARQFDWTSRKRVQRAAAAQACCGRVYVAVAACAALLSALHYATKGRKGLRLMSASQAVNLSGALQL